MSLIINEEKLIREAAAQLRPMLDSAISRLELRVDSVVSRLEVLVDDIRSSTDVEIVVRFKRREPQAPDPEPEKEVFSL